MKRESLSCPKRWKKFIYNMENRKDKIDLLKGIASGQIPLTAITGKKSLTDAEAERIYKIKWFGTTSNDDKEFLQSVNEGFLKERLTFDECSYEVLIKLKYGPNYTA